MGKGCLEAENSSNQCRSSPSVPPGLWTARVVLAKGPSQLPNFPDKQTYGNQMGLVNICSQNQLMTGYREAHES